MTVTLITTQSCCSSKSLIAETQKAIRKTNINRFKEAGYFVPDNFFEAGIFYVNKGSLTCTAAFGATRLSIRCAGNTCVEQIDEFVKLLESLDASQ